MLGSESNMDANQGVNFDTKKKDGTTDDIQSSCLSQDVLEESADRNSDDCCLCRMDGILICCDGCPAAFHSRCVGMARDLLPDGEWFCPECVVGKVHGQVKSSRPTQGADLLGIDPHGRLYFGSCGYLLVSDTCDTGPSHYYSKNDLNTVIQVLKSCSISYSGILGSIFLYGVSIESPGTSGHVECEIYQENRNFDGQLASLESPSLKEEMVKGEKILENKHNKKSTSSEHHCQSYSVPEPGHCNSVIVDQFAGITCPLVSAGDSAKLVHSPTGIQVSPTSSPVFLSSKPSVLLQESVKGSSKCDNALLITKKRKSEAIQLQSELGGYINYYSFGRVAKSVGEELMPKSSDDILKDIKRSVEDVKSWQLKAIYKKSMKFCWSDNQKVPAKTPTESCGWCFSCKYISDQDCLYLVMESKVSESLRNRTVDVCSEKKGNSHIISAVHHILSIEDNVHGLLSGPWQNPHYRKQWRANAFNAEDVASLRCLLLTLESHLRRVALSAEWLKLVDAVGTIGSASHILTSSVQVSSKHEDCRKQARKNISHPKRDISDTGSAFVSCASTKSGIYWWRGGRLSREIFHWKMLPRPLASKSGRQAGCRKIPGIFYPDGLEFAKRSKYIAWRAAVETSKNVAQLTCQVKDLDSNIRWNDLLNTQILPPYAKEFRKTTGPLWKLTIQRKCLEGEDVKYLLNFGKRKTVPETVSKHGVIFEEPSNKRTKYWLSESYIPLDLIKAYEVRKLEHLFKRASFGLLCNEERKCKMIRLRRERGLSHLFSRGQKSDNHQCGHCNKAVLEREAVNCQFCKGFFHKKHFRVPKGAITTTYTCFGCKDKKLMSEDKESVNEVKDEKSVNQRKDKKIGNERKKKFVNKCKKELVNGCKDIKFEKSKKKKRKLKPQRSMLLKRRPQRSNIAVLRRSDRLMKKKKHLAVKSKKQVAGKKKLNQSQSKVGKRSISKLKDGISWQKGLRTVISHPYWLNGLLWSIRASDEHGVQFRGTKLLLPSRLKDPHVQPVCRLCHEEYNSDAIYVGCENCGDWFHGDAFALSLENVNNLRGFKCHKCRMKSTPLCPYTKNGAVDDVQPFKGQEGAQISEVECLLENDELQGQGHNEQGFMDEDGDVVATQDNKQSLMLGRCDEIVSIDEPAAVRSHILSAAECSYLKLTEECQNQIEGRLIMMDDNLEETKSIPDLYLSGKLSDSAELHQQTLLSTSPLLDAEATKV